MRDTQSEEGRHAHDSDHPPELRQRGAVCTRTATASDTSRPDHIHPAPHWLSVLLLGAWALLTLGSLGLAVQGSIRQAERSLEHHARIHFSQLRDKLRDNEATLHAFATQLAVVPEATPQQIRQLARRLLQPHDHIYMLELVQRVPKAELADFVRQARALWHAGFTPKTFDYLQTRTWRPLPDKGEYYLLVMMEPDLPQAEAVYGLDTDSVPFLRMSLRESLRLGVPVASEPFSLAEGAGLAYVMYRPIPAGRRGVDRLALLVVKVEHLFPTAMLDDANDYRLFHDTRLAGGSELSLREHAARPAGWLAQRLLPVLEVRYEVENIRQPVGMEIRRQLRFADLYSLTLPLITVFSLLCLGLILLFLHSHRHALALERRAHDEARRLALHDALTGLGNRVLLRDRLEHALRQAQRWQRPLALLYLDLDGFKQVNDRYGHPVGDALLVEVAQRLRATLREADTVARVGGDEFVVLLDTLESLQDVPSVADKLREAVGRPYLLDGREIRVSVSIGICQYPEQGDSVEALLLCADRDMYRDKQAACTS